MEDETIYIWCNECGCYHTDREKWPHEEVKLIKTIK